MASSGEGDENVGGDGLWLLGLVVVLVFIPLKK